MVTCRERRCTTAAICHVLISMDCGRRGAVAMCGEHTLIMAAHGAVFADEHGCVIVHVADHPLEPQCRHPHSKWVDDHCEIDGLEVIDLTELDVRAPA